MHSTAAACMCPDQGRKRQAGYWGQQYPSELPPRARRKQFPFPLAVLSPGLTLVLFFLRTLHLQVWSDLFSAQGKPMWTRVHPGAGQHQMAPDTCPPVTRTLPRNQFLTWCLVTASPGAFGVPELSQHTRLQAQPRPRCLTGMLYSSSCIQRKMIV